MSRRNAALLFGCCCLMLAQGVIADQERPGKPVKVEKEPARASAKALPAAPPDAARSPRSKNGKPGTGDAVTAPAVARDPDPGLGCAKGE